MERDTGGVSKTREQSVTVVPVTEVDEDNNNIEANNNSDTDWGKVENKIEKQNGAKLTETVKAGMRFGMSSRGIATVSTCTLIDMGIVSKEDPHKITKR